MNKHKFTLLISIFITMVTFNTHAASSQAVGAMKFKPEDIAAFAKKVEKTIAAKGAQVFIIARVGRPSSELPAGFEYTHTAIGVYSNIKTSDGRTVPGYAIYNLYQKDSEPDVSELVVDYPVDFFSSTEELKAGIIIPTPELQKRILAVIGTDTYTKLHNPSYSAIANPYNTYYQNCTEHTLDVINAAIYKSADVQQLKANSRSYFEGQPVDINPFKLLMGAIAMPDIALSDQGEDEIVTATFTTIANYIEKYGMTSEKLTITMN